MRKKRHSSWLKALCLISIITIMLISTLGCTKINSYNWEEQNKITLTLQPDYKIINKSYNALTTKTEKALYYAEESISEKKRNKATTYIESVLDKVSPNDQLKVYLYNAAGSGYVLEEDGKNAIHISPSASKMDFIITTLQGVKSPYANYGLLYGIAVDLHEELGWGKIKIKKDKKIKEFVSENTDFDIYDLNYPSFTDRYGYNVEMVESIAVNFVRYIKNNFGVETLNKLIALSEGLNFEFEHRFSIYMSEYLKTVGGKYAIYPPKEIIRYSKYTADYPLRIHTISCDYYLFKGYEDPTFEENGFYFELNYSTFKEVFSNNEKAYAIIRNDFNYTKDDRVAVIIDQNDDYLEELNIGGTMDFYTGDNIRLRMILGAVHEYVHSIAIRKYGFYRNWLTESLCDYYYLDTDIITKSTYEVPIYGMYFTSIDSNPVIQQRKEYYLRYLAENNLAFNAYDLIDAMAIVNAQSSPLDVSNYSNPSSLSFLLFIINNYGIDKAIELYTNPNSFESIIGKSSDVLILDWQDYLHEKFENIAW